MTIGQILKISDLDFHGIAIHCCRESRLLLLENKIADNDSAPIPMTITMKSPIKAEESANRPTKTLLLLGDSMLRDVKNDHFKDSVVKSM